MIINTPWWKTHPLSMGYQMRTRGLRAFLGICALVASPTWAETVNVKYRGVVDLKYFKCDTISRSSLVNRVCYDNREQYMLINLQGVYYHYCEIDGGTVTQLLNADSMGRYFNASVKGKFDCRTHRVPAYK